MQEFGLRGERGKEEEVDGRCDGLRDNDGLGRRGRRRRRRREELQDGCFDAVKSVLSDVDELNDFTVRLGFPILEFDDNVPVPMILGEELDEVQSGGLVEQQDFIGKDGMSSNVACVRNNNWCLRLTGD